MKFPFTVAGHAIDNAVCFQNISPGLFYLCLQDAQRDFLKKYQVTLWSTQDTIKVSPHDLLLSPLPVPQV